jgi:adenosylmethionine-8-amino-7-oxononanoate aminotransferase
LLPTSARELPRVVRADGSRIYDAHGREYLDASSGAVTASLGHANVEVVERLAEQGRTIAFAHRTQFRSAVSDRLADLLAERAPGELSHSLLLSSGSDAIEAAMKLALRYWQVQGQPRRTRFVSRYMSYHGSTLGAASLTGHPGRRGAAEPLLHSFPAVREPQPDSCRHCAGACDASCADALEDVVLRIGPERIAAFVAEPIGGSAAGVLVPGQGYWERVREICDRYDIWWIADEVMTGIARTGRWWACQHWSAVPDVLVSGKGIGGGYMPLSAVTLRADAAESILARDGFIAFGNTFTNVPLAAAAGVVTIEIIERDGLVERAASLGEWLERELGALDRVLSAQVIVRGRGLFWGVELRDRSTGQPYPASLDVVRRMVDACRDNGLIVFRSARHIDGRRGDVILFAPPLTVTDADLTEMVSRLRGALQPLAGEISARFDGH